MNAQWLKWFPVDPPARQGAKLPVEVPGLDRDDRRGAQQKTPAGGGAGFKFGSSWRLPIRAMPQTRLSLTVWQKMPWQPLTLRLSSPVMIIVPAKTSPSCFTVPVHLLAEESLPCTMTWFR